MTQSARAPWMLAASDLKKDALFFVTVGFICGLIQLLGYRYFDKANWGADLLQEHIAFQSLLLLVAFLWLAKGLTEWTCSTRELKLTRVRALIGHIAGRTVAFASVAAFVVAGFAIVTGLSGAYFHAGVFLVFCVYLVSFAEIAANPWLRSGQSRLYRVALVIVICVPVGARLFA
ncbi:hypothetical protein [Ralstonia sp. 24A2]|uniref:hypothetical protein n=1 Tax=Ralstonia sp. 24A2 TaxID=3447364 RepID=UPI003F69C015